MNISVPLGILLASLILFYTGSSDIKNAQVFLSPHAAAIVIGGTISASLICFPIQHFFNLFKVFFRTITGQLRNEGIRTINEIVRITEVVNDGKSIIPELSAIKNRFLLESLTLLNEGGLSEEELDEVLEKRVEYQNERYKRENLTFKIIGKFPPAFGLVGTTMGMISLLQGLGGKDAFERLGPSMSIALVATFYGLVLANIFLIPIGENLAQASNDDLMLRRIVVDGVRLIREKKHPLLVREYLKSYLSHKERNEMTQGAA